MLHLSDTFDHKFLIKAKQQQKKSASLLLHYYQKVRFSLHNCTIQTHHSTAVACPLGYSNCHPGNKIKKNECGAHEEHGHETGTRERGGPRKASS